MKKTIYLLLFAIFLLQSCKEKEQPQPEILEKHCGFDLEKINFQENVPLLYSKHIMVDGMEYDSISDGKLTNEMLKYSIGNMMTDALKLKIPKEDFGFRYVSPDLDSVARFQNIYFKNMSVLTDMNKLPVAFYAESELSSAKERKLAIDAITEKYGQPKHSFCLHHEFNQCSYEWELPDRTIQIETSHGFRTTISTFEEASMEQYFEIEILIVNNDSKEALNNAHVYEFSETEKYEYDGKFYSYKDFDLSSKEIYTDRFFLNSSDEKYINEEHNLYSIERAEKYEE